MFRVTTAVAQPVLPSTLGPFPVWVKPDAFGNLDIGDMFFIPPDPDADPSLMGRPVLREKVGPRHWRPVSPKAVINGRKMVGGEMEPETPVIAFS